MKVAMYTILLTLSVLAVGSALPTEDPETITNLPTVASKNIDTDNVAVELKVTLQEQQEQLDYLYKLLHSQFANDKPQPNSTRNYLIAGRNECSTPANPPNGAVYIRWGRDVCPSTATKIYSGLSAAPRYGDIGGGAEYLCLPDTPTYDTPRSGIQARTSGLYGVEYRFDFPPLQSVLNHDVPCVACQAHGRSSVLMVPARASCPSGWTREYYGFLMATRGEEAQYRTRYVCLDRNPTYRAGTAAAMSVYFAAMQPVEGRCTDGGDGLPCGPYVDGYELTCAVCTN